MTQLSEDVQKISAKYRPNEFFRVTRGYEGIVTIHYMNKDKDDFMENYNQWYNIIKRAKLYNSYYRDERMLDKAEYFEL